MNTYHLKKFSGFLLGTVLASLISFTTTYIMNYHLSPAELGEYSYYFNLFNLSYPIVTLSLYAAYIRFNNEDGYGVFNFIFRRCILAFFVFFFVLFLFFGEFIFSFCAFVILFQERAYFYRSRQEILKYNILNVSSKFIFLLLTLTFLYSGLSNVNGLDFLSFWGGSYFFIFLFLIPSYYKIIHLKVGKQYVSKVKAKEIIKFSKMTTLMTAVIWISAVSDQFLIKLFYNFDALGEYSVAFRVITILSLISGVFLSYYPVMYYKDMDSKLTQNIIFFRRLFFFALFFGIFLLFIFSSEIYILFGAEKYLESIVYFKILIIAEGFRLSASIFMTFKSYKLQQNFIFKSLLFISVLNIVLNIMFLPIYGPIFAAISTLIVYFVYFLFSLKVYLLERKHMYFNFLEVK